MAFFGLLGNNGPLSSPDAQIAIAAGLLSGKGNWGANLSQGLLAAQNAQVQERANRQNDLQQLTGAYSMLKQQEFAKMLAAKNSGQAYIPNPMLPQMEARIAQLTGLPNLSNQGPVASRAPQGPMSLPQGPGSLQAPPAQPQGPSQMPPGMPQGMPPQGMQPPQGLSPQQQASPFGGPAMGIDPLEFMSVDPSGKSYMEALIKQQAPITTKYGVYQVDPRTGSLKTLGGMIPKDALPLNVGPDGKTSVQPLPGQLETQSALAEASSHGSEAGKFPGRVETVTMADGRVVPQLLSNVVGNPFAKGPSALPQMGQAPAPSNVAKVTVTQPSRQAQAVPQAASDPWSAVPTIAPEAGIGQSTYSQKMAGVRAEQVQKLVDKYGPLADTAQQRIALNNQAKELVDRADTGMGAAMIGDVKNFLVSRIGIPEGDFKNDPAATAALNKDLMNAAVAKAKASFGARMSTNEVNNMLKRGAPNGDMLASAIKFLLDTDNATAAYQINQANNLGKYLSMHGDPLQFEQWHAKTFPLSQVLDKMSLPKANDGWKVERVN